MPWSEKDFNYSNITICYVDNILIINMWRTVFLWFGEFHYFCVPSLFFFNTFNFIFLSDFPLHLLVVLDLLLLLALLLERRVLCPVLHGPELVVARKVCDWKSQLKVLGGDIVEYLRCVPRKGFGSAVFDSIYVHYLSIILYTNSWSETFLRHV